MAPEYVLKGHFSTKSDVFSFGVLILEIVTGQKNSRAQNDNEIVEGLVSYVSTIILFLFSFFSLLEKF